MGKISAKDQAEEETKDTVLDLPGNIAPKVKNPVDRKSMPVMASESMLCKSWNFFLHIPGPALESKLLTDFLSYISTDARGEWKIREVT